MSRGLLDLSGPRQNGEGKLKGTLQGGAKKLTGVHRGWAVKGRAGGWTRVVQQLNCLVTKLQKDSNLFSFN